jgi:hypothetical protein
MNKKQQTKDKTMNDQTSKVIYEMLTENTGKHFLDSGGEDGRHWQHNQKRSFKDFKNEPEISKDDDIITKSLFHHLNESCTYLPKLTNQFNDWINEDKYHYFDNPNGRSHIIADVQDFMNEYIYPETKADCTYTYNFDNCLSQDIQWISSGELYQNDIIALCIHNGADARGGMTDYKFFKIDPDMFYMMDEEYYKDVA